MERNGMLHMIVEQTRDHPMRMEYDPQAGTFRETEYRSLAAVRGFTNPYGWIKESGTPPQPHWDCILLSDGEFSLGNEVEIRVIGVFQRADGDHKYIAVEHLRKISDLSEITDEEREQLQKLYPKVREGEGWFGAERATALLADAPN